MKKSTIGIIGLGKMGSNLALNAIDKGYSVAGYDKSLHLDLQDSGILVVTELKNLLEHLSNPKIIFIYIPAGKMVDDVITELQPMLGSGDIIIDGGNSYWGDSINRAARLQQQGIYFIDCGTSGGVSGA